MVASGIPNRNGEKHVQEIALLSLDLLHTIEKMVVPHLRHEKIKLRLGMNTGMVWTAYVDVNGYFHWLFVLHANLIRLNQSITCFRLKDNSVHLQALPLW